MTARQPGRPSLPATTSIANVTLRGASAGGKFVLLVVLASTTDPVAVGLYGLVAATVTLALYVVGLDYYTHTTRQLLRSVGPSPAELVRDQVSLQGWMYLASMLPVAVLFTVGLLPWRIAPWFIGILLTEHASLEFYRLLIASKKPLRANVVFFLRSGSWSLGWAGIALVWPAARSLDAVWTAWLLGGLLAIGAGVGWTRELLAGAVAARPDWQRIRRGLRVAGRFLVATVAFRAMLTIDRYVIEAFLGTEDVGVYTLYIGIANAVVLIVQSGVVVILYPGLVEDLDRGNEAAFSAKLSGFRRMVRVSALGAAALVAGAAGPLLSIVGDSVYREDLTSLWILLAGTTFAALSFIPHYILYALDRDREIMLVTLGALVVAVAGDLMLVPILGLNGAAVATLLGFLTLAGGKTVVARGVLGASPRG